MPRSTGCATATRRTRVAPRPAAPAKPAITTARSRTVARSFRPWPNRAKLPFFVHFLLSSAAFRTRGELMRRSLLAALLLVGCGAPTATDLGTHQPERVLGAIDRGPMDRDQIVDLVVGLKLRDVEGLHTLLRSL